MRKNSGREDTNGGETLSRRTILRSTGVAAVAGGLGTVQASAATETPEPQQLQAELRGESVLLDWLASEGIDTDAMVSVDRVVRPDELSPETVGAMNGVARVTSSKIDPTTGGRIELRRQIDGRTVDLVVESNFEPSHAAIRDGDTVTVRTNDGNVFTHEARLSDDDATSTAQYECLYNGVDACEYYYVYCDYDPCYTSPTYDRCYYTTCPISCDQVCY